MGGKGYLWGFGGKDRERSSVDLSRSCYMLLKPLAKHESAYCIKKSLASRTLLFLSNKLTSLFLYIAVFHSRRVL